MGETEFLKKELLQKIANAASIAGVISQTDELDVLATRVKVIKSAVSDLDRPELMMIIEEIEQALIEKDHALCAILLNYLHRKYEA